MFEFPRRLRVVEGRGVTGEFELIHQLLRFARLCPASSSVMKMLYFDQLSRLIFLFARSA